MSKRKAKAMPEYTPGRYPSVFKKGTLGFVLDQEKGVEKVTVARKAAMRAPVLVASIQQAVAELSQRTITKAIHLTELDDVGRRLEIIIQEIDDG